MTWRKDSNVVVWTPGYPGGPLAEIPGFSRYRATADGFLWSRHGRRTRTHGLAWHRMSPRVDKHIGYYRTKMLDDLGVSRSVLVHRAILLAFVGPCPDGHEGCHDNGDPLDNSAANLRWDSRASNMADKRRHGTLPIGARIGIAKLTDDAVLEIRRRLARGAKNSEIARDFGIAQSNVSAIRTSFTWRHLPSVAELRSA